MSSKVTGRGVAGVVLVALGRLGLLGRRLGPGEDGAVQLGGHVGHGDVGPVGLLGDLARLARVPAHRHRVLRLAAVALEGVPGLDHLADRQDLAGAPVGDHQVAGLQLAEGPQLGRLLGRGRLVAVVARREGLVEGALERRLVVEGREVPERVPALHAGEAPGEARVPELRVVPRRDLHDARRRLAAGQREDGRQLRLGHREVGAPGVPEDGQVDQVGVGAEGLAVQGGLVDLVDTDAAPQPRGDLGLALAEGRVGGIRRQHLGRRRHLPARQHPALLPRQPEEHRLPDLDAVPVLVDLPGELGQLPQGPAEVEVGRVGLEDPGGGRRLGRGGTEVVRRLPRLADLGEPLEERGQLRGPGGHGHLHLDLAHALLEPGLALRVPPVALHGLIAPAQPLGPQLVQLHERQAARVQEHHEVVELGALAVPLAQEEVQLRAARPAPGTRRGPACSGPTDATSGWSRRERARPLGRPPRPTPSPTPPPATCPCSSSRSIRATVPQARGGKGFLSGLFLDRDRSRGLCQFGTERPWPCATGTLRAFRNRYCAARVCENACRDQRSVPGGASRRTLRPRRSLHDRRLATLLTRVSSRKASPRRFLRPRVRVQVPAAP